MAAVEPIATFTRQHPQTGKKQERVAYSPAEAVQLRADGWAEVKASKSTSSTSTAAGNRSGSSS